MRDEFDSTDRWLEDPGEVRVRRLPSPGIAAVLSIFWPGVGHVYTGRLMAGLAWFVGVALAYWLFFFPGLLPHMICVWAAYRAAEEAGR